jgi:sugar phosphate isomerase/epimerase
MVPIGFMAWRIGGLLDVYQQFDWILTAGFDGVGFHASQGVAGQWQGVDPVTCRGEARAHLRRVLDRCALVEVHAPFALELSLATLRPAMDGLDPVLAFAGDVGASVVTVHARLPEARSEAAADAWHGALDQLDRTAASRGTMVGLETVAGLERVRSGVFRRVGITLDVGHVTLAEGRQELEASGGIAALIHGLGGALVHLHVHDVVGRRDHVEPGTGCIDFSALGAALRATGYRHGIMLELNPDHVSPEGIQRSRAYVAASLEGNGT